MPERSDAPAPLDYVHHVGPSRHVASHTLLMQNSAPGHQRLLRARDAVTLEAQVLDVLGQRQQNLPQSALCRFTALPPEKLCVEGDDGMWNVRCGHFCRCGHSCFKMSGTVLISGLYFLLLVAFAYIAEKY